jgi:hypothetical protein
MTETIAAPKPDPTYGPPLKPQRKLAIGLLGLFIAWLAVLWVMYFTTVHPHDHVEREGPEGVSKDGKTLTVPRG